MDLLLDHEPLVARLVERWTVEETQASIGRWFKSGPEDVLWRIFQPLTEQNLVTTGTV